MKAIKTNMHNRRAGFTMVEIMVVLSILVVLASLAIPSLLESRKVAIAGAAEELAVQLNDSYNNWTHAGGQHSTTGGKDLTELLLTTMTGPVSTTGVNTTQGTATVDETVFLVGGRSAAGAVRTTLPRTVVSEPGPSGRILYDDKFEIQFSPIAKDKGTWTVAVSDAKYQ